MQREGVLPTKQSLLYESHFPCPVLFYGRIIIRGASHSTKALLATRPGSPRETLAPWLLSKPQPTTRTCPPSHCQLVRNYSYREYAFILRWLLSTFRAPAIRFPYRIVLNGSSRFDRRSPARHFSYPRAKISRKPWNSLLKIDFRLENQVLWLMHNDPT